MFTNLTMFRGDTASFGLEFKDVDVELTSAYLSCKQNYDDEQYVFQKSLGDGISRVGNRQYTVRVAPEDTQDVAVGDYVYDFQVEANGDKFTLLAGVLRLLDDTSRN